MSHIENFNHVSHIKSTCLNQVIHQTRDQTDRKHSKKYLGRGSILKPTERAQVLLKNATRDFQNRPPIKRSAYFYMTITADFERFQYFEFETSFLKNENTLKRLKYPFSVEITTIQNATFP